MDSWWPLASRINRLTVRWQSRFLRVTVLLTHFGRETPLCGAHSCSSVWYWRR
jgi:hypothetical protein